MITLSAFMKDLSKHTDLARSMTCTRIFNEYVKANNIKFRDELELNKCRRMFWIAYVIRERMQEYGNQANNNSN